jgi:hypothetical protein
MARHGQALVQWALVVPLALLGLLAAIGYGWVGFSAATAANAARTAATLAAAGASPCQVWAVVDGMLTAAHPWAPPVVEFHYGAGARTTWCAVPAFGGVPACRPSMGVSRGEPLLVRVVFTGSAVVPVPGFTGEEYQLILGARSYGAPGRSEQNLPDSCPAG